ncbi:uroporphyrinogen-III synthase [Flagellimonas meridianipacifica]|uniref:Uroporphyrinogen-III synthase n=1 Tax=Flagellimonas meridianipacifica TaxID=1080225 RepID=A0A2T0MHL0_9FLAO|nr:uroporphyrinogen-III synthase [Allomuricauda pacifica]PRX57063.1 uroporphyrinogen-III synthase [Allomuricauda pacifica]
MKTVLSTRILTLPQKELLLNSGIGFVEYDALNISLLDFEIPNYSTHVIVTSKNGAKSFLKAFNANTNNQPKNVFRFYCVGEKTKRFLEDSGFLVAEMTLSASLLGSLIISKYKTNRFIFISGNLRRNDIPDLLSKYNVQYQEIQGYNTLLKEKNFNTNFDGYLFYSPSGIKSFLRLNSLPKTPLFCIGETTAQEAKKYSDNIIIANKPTVENVLVQVVKHFKRK